MLGARLPILLLSQGVIAGAEPPLKWLARRFLSSDELEFLQAAIALLQLNLDIAEWVVCLALSWMPAPLTSDEHQSILDCTMGALRGGVAVYVVDRFVGEGATGAATDMLAARGVHTDPSGVIIPIGHPYWQDASAQSRLGGTGALCAVAALSAVIFHEVLHLCGVVTYPDGSTVNFADDSELCFAIQNQVAMSFLWALGQRYDCLRAAPCCPKTAESWFMSSEPDPAPGPMPWLRTTSC